MHNILYDISCDEVNWVIKSSHDSSYTIINKNSYVAFHLSGDIIGINQIANDTFLIHRRLQRHRCEIYRLKIIGETPIKEFSQTFEHFHLLNDDIILFQNPTMVYSISKNAEIKDFTDCLRDCDFSFKKGVLGNPVLYVEHKITWPNLPNNYVIVMLDANTFKPITQAYSTLRNKLILLDDNFTFQDLIDEDKYYAEVISDFLFVENHKSYNLGKKTLYTQCPVI